MRRARARSSARCRTPRNRAADRRTAAPVTGDPTVTRRRALVPGVVLCIALALLSSVLQYAEERLVGHAIIEGLVIAILLGMLVRAIRPPDASYEPGIDFSAKQLLELAIVLLGASVNLPELLRAGPALLGGIVTIVASRSPFGYSIGRVFGLAPKLAVLVAVGNAICGNSAIAAVAPVIGADARDVASSIAFTAMLGVVVVLGLPLLIGPLALSHYQYGVLAGLTRLCGAAGAGRDLPRERAGRRRWARS